MRLTLMQLVAKSNQKVLSCRQEARELAKNRKSYGEGCIAAHALDLIGGYDGPVCPPNADCARPETGRRADGAAYDPASGTWEAIADAPEPLVRLR